MTKEEAAAILESEANYLYSQDEPYNRQAFTMAIESLRGRNTDKQKQNTEESKEDISKVIMLMRTIAIECRHAKTCFECKYKGNLSVPGTSPSICGLDVGFPYEWDKHTLRAFQVALNHAVDLTITKGDETQ